MQYDLKMSMLNKKSSYANLENKRSLYILIGYVTAIALLYVSLEWRSGGVLPHFFDDDEYTFREDFIPITWEIPPLEEFAPISLPAESKPGSSISILGSGGSEIRIVDDIAAEFSETITETSDNIAAGGGGHAASSTTNEPPEKEEVAAGYELDELPEFPGGLAALRRYIFNYLIYPQDAIKRRIEGTVLCSFLITSTGQINDVEVLQGQTPEMDEEAIRVISRMPIWRPGIQKKKPVTVRYVMPIVFVLSNTGDLHQP